MPRNRLLLLAAALAAAIVIVVVVILAAGGGGESDSPASTSTASETTASAQASPFFGIPQHGDTIGRADAPATLTVYEDPQCPFCREWALGTLPDVLRDFVRPGKVKLVYRGIQVIGPNSQAGLRAIYAAGRQNKLWNLADALYRRQGAENSGWITSGVVADASQAVGVDVSTLKADIPKTTAELRAAAAGADADRVQGTPTFVLQRPPSVPQQLQLSALDSASFESALTAALQ